MRGLQTNCYHTVYGVGDAVRLVQFAFEREGAPLSVVALEEVIRLAKVHPRYVYPLQVRSVVVLVDEVITHGLHQQGCTASGTMPGSRDLLIAHHQYPTYIKDAYEKPRWHVYQLDLSWQGKYTYTDWEDHRWVLRHTDKIRYKPLRNKLRALTLCASR